MGFVMLPNGCSWYETNRLGGCIRREPRPECVPPESHATPAQHRLAVLVPYRSKQKEVNLHHVATLCERLSSHLRWRRVQHQIFIINQVDSAPFNRGALVNAAVATLRGLSRSSTKGPRRSFDYLAIHDFDRYPVWRNDTACMDAASNYYAFPSKNPRALNPSSFAGGVLVIPTALFRAVNGFSNSYWGWGEEDNDLFIRLRWCGLPPVHGAKLDQCMEHVDCEACKRQKEDVDKAALAAHTRRFRQRLPSPRQYMLHDGLTTLNFTLRRPQYSVTCGSAHSSTVKVVDVDLSSGFTDRYTGV
jgi:xylosylprotein 4-beta-galactosyltransferase